jgi:hypothetical protein
MLSDSLNTFKAFREDIFQSFAFWADEQWRCRMLCLVIQRSSIKKPYRKSLSNTLSSSNKKLPLSSDGCGGE